MDRINFIKQNTAQTLVLVFLMIVLPAYVHADEAGLQEVVKKFNASYENGNYNAVIKTGEMLVHEIPDDDILQFRLAHAFFRFGRFDKVVEIAQKNESVTYLRNDNVKVSMDDLGFLAYPYMIWQMGIMAKAASGNTAEALKELQLIARFNDPLMQFVRYLLLIHAGQKETAEKFQKEAFPSDYSGKVEGELYAKRILPAMGNPDALSSYLKTVATHNEYCLLLSSVGFTHFCSGKKEKGLQLIRRAVQEENTSLYGSIPLMLLSLLSQDKNEFRKLAAETLENDRWRKYASLSSEFVEAYYNEADYEKALYLLEEQQKLSPKDRDNILAIGFINMIMGRWEEAEASYRSLLEKNFWNSENVVCGKLYLPIVYLIQNKQQKYTEAIGRLSNEPLPANWKIIGDTIKDPSLFEVSEVHLKEKTNYLCVLLSTNALLAEVEGDYITAEKRYMDIISNSKFAQFMEYNLADKRLQIIAPLAAIQRME